MTSHRAQRQHIIGWRAIATLGCTALAACGGGSRRAATTGGAPPTPVAAPSTSYAGGAGAPAGASTASPQSGLWGIGQAACPASSATGGTGATPATRGDSATSRGSTTTLGAADTRRPSIVLRASASAREVRFATQPRIVVRLCGGTLDSVHVIERRNLPSPVVAGTTYRDVYVAVEILGHLDAACIRSTLGGGGATPAPAACGSLSITDSAGARTAPARRPPAP